MGGKRGDRSTSATQRLIGVVTSRREVLREHAPGARRGTVVGVHQARVATRRLRELVPVTAVGLERVRRRRLLRALRDMTRGLGGVRECDVALGMVAGLEDSVTPALRPALRHWLQALRARRRLARAHLLEACSAERVSRVVGWLDDLAAARAESPDDAWRERLARQLDTRARTLRLSIDDAGVLFVPEALHEVRIAAKRLRYAIELVGECRLATVGRTLSTLKRAQDALGHLHDLDVLLAIGPWSQLTPAPSGRVSMVGPSLDWSPLVSRLDGERRSLHARYVRRRSALIRIADDVRDRLVGRARPFHGGDAREGARLVAD